MRESLTEQVFHTLEEEILNGTRQPGDTLPELQLCQDLQVSRTPVREALVRLEQAGLAELLPNRSVVVTGISVQDMLDIYEVRLRIEGLAARRCADRITEEELLQLRRTLDLQEFYTIKDRPDELRAMDSQFHQELYELCGSPVLSILLTDLHRKVQRFRRSSLAATDRAAAAMEEHRAICEALAAHDGDRAEELTVRHIRCARDHLLELYAKQGHTEPTD